MNIVFNCTEEYLEEMDTILKTDGIDRDTVRIGRVDAENESLTETYLSSTFASDGDVYELMVFCGRDDQYTSDGQKEFSKVRAVLYQAISDKGVTLRGGRIDG